MHVIWREVVQVEVAPLSLDLPLLATLDWAAAALSILALIAVFRLKRGTATVLTGAAALALALHLVGLA